MRYKGSTGQGRAGPRQGRMQVRLLLIEHCEHIHVVGLLVVVTLKYLCNLEIFEYLKSD
jgi:hypothetical protein